MAAATGGGRLTLPRMVRSVRRTWVQIHWVVSHCTLALNLSIISCTLHGRPFSSASLRWCACLLPSAHGRQALLTSGRGGAQAAHQHHDADALAASFWACDVLAVDPHGCITGGRACLHGNMHACKGLAGKGEGDAHRSRAKVAEEGRGIVLPPPGEPGRPLGAHHLLPQHPAPQQHPRHHSRPSCTTSHGRANSCLTVIVPLRPQG